MHCESKQRETKLLPQNSFAERLSGKFATESYLNIPVLFCSLAILDLMVGHTMDVLSPFIPVLVGGVA